MDGKSPYTLAVIGDMAIVDVSTGEVASGSTTIVYLTDNGESGGKSLFGQMPFVQVASDRDRTPGGLSRAGSPPSPSKALNLTLGASADVCWIPGASTWGVEITNSTGAATGFSVKAWGTK
jgi:hypothetical protein